MRTWHKSENNTKHTAWLNCCLIAAIPERNIRCLANVDGIRVIETEHKIWARDPAIICFRLMFIFYLRLQLFVRLLLTINAHLLESFAEIYIVHKRIISVINYSGSLGGNESGWFWERRKAIHERVERDAMSKSAIQLRLEFHIPIELINYTHKKTTAN